MASASEWLGSLYERFRTELFLTAWSTLRQREQAEDAVHGAVVRLAALERPPREPKLYLFRAVRNAAIDLQRTRTRRGERPLAEAFDPVDRGEEGCPTFDDAARQGVREQLARLATHERETIELHLYAGLTFQEIADLLDEPLGTVASRYRRALAKLAANLETHHA